MAIHSHRNEHLRRRRESLGHVKITLAQLSDLVDQWSQVCDSITISIGDGHVADYVEDLQSVTKAERSHLVIRTENPTTKISLRKYKAELSYIQHSEDIAAIANIRLSLRQYRTKLPVYRLRTFWWWIYITACTSTVLIYRNLRSWKDPFWPYLFPLGALAFLTFWLFYSIHKLSLRSSTRLVIPRR